MVVRPPVQDEPRRVLAPVARFALAVMTSLLARCALASAMVLLVVVFALGPAIKPPVSCLAVLAPWVIPAVLVGVVW